MPHPTALLPAAPLLGAVATAAGVRSGALDPVALVEAALARAAAVEPVLGALVHVDAEAALAEARDRRGGDGPLQGVPVVVKDLFDVAGQPTRAGSAVPPGPPATTDAPAVARLRAAGAVVLARSRTHEFAWGLTTQHATLGSTANPHDPTRVPGGSSGGSAAAVAAGIAVLGLGTDTGCSIRLPAAWCGLVGHKPSAGLVPLDGCVPLSASLDHGGALTRDAADARLALEVLSGRRLPPVQVPSGLRLGVVTAAVTSDGVGARLDEAVRRAAALGTLRDVALPRADGLVGLYGRVGGPEALAWHRATGRWPAHAASYGPDVRAQLERCDAAVAAGEWADPTEERAGLRADVARLFETTDLLLLPVATCGPPTAADPDAALDGRRLRDAVLPVTVLANLCGLPACSVPAGLDDDGLPVGLQVVGPPGADALVLDAAAALAPR